MTLSGVTRSADAEMSAMLAAESLSIEPFERSRWRVRWTRSGQLCPFNRWESWTEGRAVTDVGPITTATRSRAAAARAAGVSNSQLRIHLRRRRVRARHIEAGEVRARFTRCDAGEERVEEELSCRQPFDDAHGGTAARTWPRRSWWCGAGRVDRWRWGAGKRLATLG
jgi:hypothetical protein